MTTPTGNTYVDRLRDILATIPRIGTDVSDGKDLRATPGYEVFLKGARHERSSGAKRRQVARVLSVRVYYVLVDATKEDALRIARAQVQDVIEDYVDTIYDHVNLALNDAGIVRVGNADDSIGILPYGSNTYFGFDIDLTINYPRG